MLINLDKISEGFKIRMEFISSKLNLISDMTDSGFTRSTYSKKSQNRSMFDSAIGADLLSSDEGSVHNEGENNKR